ncbi:hypothetical protein [Nostoc sp.]|uniref:hypothetical protein n=1 Tax=Nostoc sp. TaxID=1180 RepID=UPI002FEE9B7E
MTPPSMIAYLYIVTQLRSQNWCYGKNLPVDGYSYFFRGGYPEQTAKDDSDWSVKFTASVV